jgi:hypothetical protein
MSKTLTELQLIIVNQLNIMCDKYDGYFLSHKGLRVDFLWLLDTLMKIVEITYH